MSRATTTFTLLALAGCGGPGTIAVQVLVPDLSGVDTPLPGVVITALPYDRDSILSAMEGRAPGGGGGASGSPGAGELDARLGVAEDSLRALEPKLNRTRAELNVARDTLWPRIERLRAAVRRWGRT